MKDYTDTRIEQLIKRRATLIKLLILVYLIALTISNLIGTSFAAFIVSLPYPFFDRRNLPAAMAQFIGDQRSTPGKVTPRLAITTSFGMMVITGSSFFFASALDPVWIYVPPIFALYTVLVMVVRQVRILAIHPD